ncbi:MAG TPA: TIGR04086 family membrane protein [Candidatus Ventrimonas merdavium]|nr:TIGR04086 family membrane protein [Candidatus Ventrimonas merdavium]
MNASKPQTLLRALLVSYLLSGVLLILLSLALYRLKLPEEQINLAVYGVYAAACFFGGFLSGRSIKSRRFFWGLITGLLYFAVLTAVSFLTAHGDAPDTSRLASVLAVCAAAGTAGGMMS